MRLHLVLALLTALALYLTFRGAPRAKFSFADVQALAQKQAAVKFQPLADVLPPGLKKLSPVQELGVFWNDRYRLWRSRGLPFQVDFYPLSNDQHTSPQINVIDRHGAQPLSYENSFFRFNVPIDPPLPPNGGYGGFYVRFPHMAPKSDPASPLTDFSRSRARATFASWRETRFMASPRGHWRSTLSRKARKNSRSSLPGGFTSRRPVRRI